MNRPGLKVLCLLLVIHFEAISDVGAATAAAAIQLQQTIDNPHPQQSRYFGWSLDTFNDDLLVGSYGGSVYVIDPLTGIESLRLESPEGFGSFGRSVTQFGDEIVVGANEFDIAPHVRVGSAYVFDGTTGAHLRTLRNPNPSHFGWFGFSMEEAAGKLFISSESASSGESGNVYVYDASSTTPIGTLVNPQAANSNAWGFGFALKENKGDLFVSAPGAQTAGQATGAIYRYDAATLARELTILNPNPQADATFGRSIFSSGSLLLAGAPGQNVGGVYQAGGAYLFDADTGALLQTFLNPAPNEFASFGESVAIVRNFAVIGAPLYWPNPGHHPGYVGAAFVFELSTGKFVTRIDSPTFGQNDWFGGADGTAITSIRGQLAIGHGYGERVYLFSVPEPTSLGLAFAAGSALVVRLRRGVASGK